MFNQTYRLSNRGAYFTSKFYSKNILSANHNPNKYFYFGLDKKYESLFHKDGGPFWLQLKMPNGEDVPQNAIVLTAAIIDQLKKVNDKLDISVLTKLKKTVTQLQLTIGSTVGNNDRILIDTVERVQGMTCDVCIFIIPNKNLSMSLEPSFFNVATSRASRHTIIIADPDILNNPACQAGTRKYLEELDENSALLIKNIQSIS